VRTDLLTWHRRRSPPSAEALLRQRGWPHTRGCPRMHPAQVEDHLAGILKDRGHLPFEVVGVAGVQLVDVRVTTPPSPTFSTVGCMLLPILWFCRLSGRFAPPGGERGVSRLVPKQA